MIIDSHTHYAYPRYDMEFYYLSCKDNEYMVGRAKREELISEMKDSGIVGFIEPSIGFDSIEKQISRAKENKNCMWLGIGVHPTRCVNTKWEKRKMLKEYCEKNNAVAVGETGLDYHHPRIKQHRLRQKRWFVYQIKLAEELNLPLILHIRKADKDALKILKKHKARLKGGVVHCFTLDSKVAKEYIDLGFVLGIGGKLLVNDDEGRALCDTVKNVPLNSLLIETDAPFVLPEIDEELCQGKKRKKLCNSSLILPKVIDKIAELRGITSKEVESATYNTTIKTFNLKI